MTNGETIGIYGGTFDPPHAGHVQAAAAAMQALKLDRLLVVPAGIPPHKRLPRETASAAARLEMAGLAFASVEGVQLCDLELRREGKSYTVDTLRALRAQYPAAELTLLMGTDMLLSFEQWRDFREIFRLARLGVFARADGDDARILQCIAEFRQKYQARIVLVENSAVDVSSSRLRALLPERQGAEYLPAQVYAYIVRSGLYGVRTELSWLRRQILPGLKPHRAEHTLGVEATAAALARRWGADENDAREAAILHDATKNLDLSQQLRLCGKYGIITDACERSSVGLLHAKTAAALAEAVYGAPAHICSAVRWHTTGRENMTLLEKIIYLADYIEPCRSFPGVDHVRALAREDLDAALLTAFRMSLENLKERGIEPHQNTLLALRWLSAQKQ